MENNLKVISWNITKRCNLRCKHCYLPAEFKTDNSREPDESSELNTQESLHLIDQIAATNPEVLLILSGGEPLLRADIYDLTEYASNKGMMVVLGTNGLLVTNEVASKMKQKGLSGVSISLDSENPAIHDSFRMIDESWEKAVQAIKICKSHDLSVQINTVVTNDNYSEIKELIEFARSLDADVFSPFFLVCTGRGEDMTDITPEQYEQLLTMIMKAQKNNGDMMIRTRCAPTFRRILYQDNPESNLLKLDAGKCMAGVHYCRITPQGRVTPCPYMPVFAGDTREESFYNIWEHAGEFLSLRNPALKGKCNICEFRLICGGCRARAYATTNDTMKEDPWCIYSPEGKSIIHPPVFDMINTEPDSNNEYIPLWTDEAEERLIRVPFFVRPMVKGAVERFAVDNKYKEITPDVMKEARKKYGMSQMSRN
jgi:radical SAM protein with 4Fe4S-binding SPASM domain